MAVINQWHLMESSTIHSVRYYSMERRLEIRFKNKEFADDTENAEKVGAVYHYQGVTPETYDALLAAPSIGTAFFTLIRTDKSLKVTKITDG